MRITSLEEYGLRCLLAIARTGPGGQASISEISALEGLSVPYTSKLLSLLRKAGLVTAVRGRKGGFAVARDLEDITLFEVLTTLGGPMLDPDHCTKFTGQLDVCVHGVDCSVHHVLGSLAGLIESTLKQTTIADLVFQGPGPRYEPMPIAIESLSKKTSHRLPGKRNEM